MGLWESSVAQPGHQHHHDRSHDHCPSHSHTHTDLLSFAFTPPTPYDETRPLFIDAEDPSRWLSGPQFRLLVRTLIAGLKAHHVQRGDCVLIHLGNNIIYPALFFSVIGAGGVFMGSNPRSQPQELDHILQLADPKLIITSRDALPTVLTVSASRGMLPSQVVLLDESAPDHIAHLLLAGPLGYAAANAPYLPTGGATAGGGVLNFAHLLAYGENDWVAFTSEAVAKATPAAMFSTSGTGGLPKAAVLSHHAIIAHHRSIHYDVPYPVTRLLSLPLFHLFGALWAHIQPIRYGQPLYVLPRFDIPQYLSAVFQYQITETYMVPAMIHAVNRCALPVADYLASLRYVGVAGAPIDGAAMQQFNDRLHPGARAGQLWGMTEVGVVFQNRYGEPGHAASIGRRLPGYDVRLVAPDGRIIHDQNQPGELYVRGAGVLTGYKGRSDATDAQGWFRTGDVAYVSHGLYYIVGRTKELIKVRGWQVAPAELEAVLLQHPGIADAAVTGVTARDGSTEVPRAFVVRAPGAAGSRLTAEEVYQFARRRLASYKALDGGVLFVEEIPRTASGKIQRFKLTQMNTYREMVSALLARFKGASLHGVGLMHQGRIPRVTS